MFVFYVCKAIMIDEERRQVLGRNVSIGSYYNAMRDTILDETLPDSLIKPMQKPYNISSCNVTCKNRSSKFLQDSGIEGELQLSILAGLCVNAKVKLLDNNSDTSVYGSIYCTNIVRKDIISSDTIKTYIENNPGSFTDATHVIIGINYGTYAIASYSYRDEEHVFDTDSKISVKINKLKDNNTDNNRDKLLDRIRSLRPNVSTECATSEKKSKFAKDYQFNIDGTLSKTFKIPVNYGNIVNKLEDIMSHMQSEPPFPIEIILYPLSYRAFPIPGKTFKDIVEQFEKPNVDRIKIQNAIVKFRETGNIKQLEIDLFHDGSRRNMNMAAMSLTHRQEVIANDDILTVTQRALFYIQYGLLDEKKELYKRILTTLEDNTTHTKLSEKGEELVESRSTLSTCRTSLQSMDNKMKQYKSMNKQELIEEIKYSTDEDEILINIILSEKYPPKNTLIQKYKSMTEQELIKEIQYSTNAGEKSLMKKILYEKNPQMASMFADNYEPRGHVSTMKIMDALDKYTSNISSLFDATIESRTKMSEYLSDTKYVENVKLSILSTKIGAKVAIVAGAASIAIVALFLSTALIVVSGPAAAVASGYALVTTGTAAFVTTSAVGAFVATSYLSSKAMQYLDNTRLEYHKNCKRIYEILYNDKNTNKKIWELEENIYNNLEEYRKLCPEEKNNYVNKDKRLSLFIPESNCKKFATYLDTLCLFHELRKDMICNNGFDIGVVGQTNAGKTKFIQHLNFKSADPSIYTNTTKIERYFHEDNDFSFIDFPGFDDSRKELTNEYNKIYHIIDMYIVILNVTELHTRTQRHFLLEMLEHNVYTIIIYNKSDILTKTPKGEKPCTVDNFKNKIKDFEEFMLKKNKKFEKAKKFVCTLTNGSETETIEWQDIIKKYGIFNHKKTISHVLQILKEEHGRKLNNDQCAFLQQNL